MRPQVALLSVIVALVAGALAVAGCGGGDHEASDASPQALLSQTFGKDAAIKSGRIAIALKAQVEGSPAVDAKVAARFESASGKDALPRFDGTLDLSSQGGSLRAGAISTGDAGFVTLAGTAYKLSDAQFAQLKQGYLADQAKSAAQSSKTPSLGALGIHPLDWLRDPKAVGEEQIGDARTVHVAAAVDVPAMIADVGKLVARNGLAKQLSADQLEQLRGSVKRATVDVYTGKDDHRLRRIAIALVLKSGTVDLAIQYDDLDRPQKIVAPSSSRPLSELTDALGRAAGGAGGGSGQRYSQCLQQADGDLAKVQACAKYL